MMFLRKRIYFIYRNATYTYSFMYIFSSVIDLHVKIKFCIGPLLKIYKLFTYNFSPKDTLDKVFHENVNMSSVSVISLPSGSILHNVYHRGIYNQDCH